MRNQIESVFAELSRETDEYVSERLEHELRRLDKMIVLESGELYSVDALIKQARDSKREKRRRYGGTTPGYDPRSAYSEGMPSHIYREGVMSDRPLTSREMYMR